MVFCSLDRQIHVAADVVAHERKTLTARSYSRVPVNLKAAVEPELEMSESMTDAPPGMLQEAYATFSQGKHKN